MIENTVILVPKVEYDRCGIILILLKGCLSCNHECESRWPLQALIARRYDEIDVVFGLVHVVRPERTHGVDDHVYGSTVVAQVIDWVDDATCGFGVHLAHMRQSGVSIECFDHIGGSHLLVVLVGEVSELFTAFAQDINLSLAVATISHHKDPILGEVRGTYLSARGRKCAT
jgi:hypothetical protein